MPTISQAEINRLKFKSGLSDADITAKLQEKGYTAPGTIQEAGVTLPGYTAKRSAILNPTVPTTSPVTTSSDVRSTFDKNVEKLDSASYAYNYILSPNVTGRTVDTNTKPTTTPTTTTPTTTTTTTPTATTPTTPTTTTTPTAPSGSTDSEYTKTLKDIEAIRKSELERLDADSKKRQELYDAMMAKSDAAHQSLLQSIKTQFDQTRAKMTDTNSRFNAITRQNQYLVNGFRYTPQQAEGMVYDAEQAGLSRLAAIDSQYAEALQKAQTAKDERDYKNLNDLMTNLDNIATKRRQVLQEMATGAKDIQDSLNNVENMTQTQADMMGKMMEGYGIDVENIPLAEREEWYKEKAQEISDSTGVTISPAYVKTQMSRYNQKAQQAAKAPDIAQSTMRGYYVNAKGDPILTADGKQIAYNPGDKTVFNEKTGQMIISGTDMYGNPTFKAVNVEGWINPTPTSAGYTVGGVHSSQLSTVYKGVMPGLIDATPGTLIPTTNPAYRNINNGGMQCGEYVNRITGTNYGDTLEEKKRVGNESTGGVGSTVVIDVGNDIGHVGIIMEDLGNAWKVKSSNYHMDGRVSEDIVPKSKAVGYKTPDAVKMAGTTQYDDERKTFMNQIGDYLRSNKSITKIQQAELDRLGLTQSQVTAFMDKPFYERATDTQKAEAKKIADEAELLLNHPGIDAATGKSSVFNFMPGTPGYDFATQLESFIAKLAIPNLSMLKGPMSDKDIEFIKQASSSLAKTGQTTEQYKASLMKLIQDATGRSMGTANTDAPGAVTTQKSAVDSLTSSGLLK